MDNSIVAQKMKIGLLCIISSILLTGSRGEVNISALMTDLFTNYHSDVRPMCEVDGPVQVKVGFALRQIIDLNEPRQILEINAWIRLRWNDCQLTWNSSLYGIDSVIVPYDKIWVPDITLYDNVKTLLEGVKDFRPAIYSNGDIVYNFPTIISSLCKVDVTYFPFDTQICILTFGSWAYSGLDLNVTNKSAEGDLTSFVDSVEWTVTSIPVQRHVQYYACCINEPYPDIRFSLHLERKPLFYLMNLLFPCMLISTVACLGFLLPPDSGEKVSLEITVLLSLAVFLLVVSETMPPSSETFPYIGIYFACAMLLVSFSCLMTVIVLNLHFKGSHGKQMPHYVKTLFLHFLGRLVCIKYDRSGTVRKHSVSPTLSPTFHHDNRSFEEDGKPTKNGDADIADHVHGQNGFTSIGIHDNGIQDINLHSIHSDRGKDVTYSNSLPESNKLVSTLHRQLESIKAIETLLMAKKRLEDSTEEWQLLAQVLDRVFLILFIIISFIATLSILLKSSLH